VKQLQKIHLQHFLMTQLTTTLRNLRAPPRLNWVDLNDIMSQSHLPGDNGKNHLEKIGSRIFIEQSAIELWTMPHFIAPRRFASFGVQQTSHKIRGSISELANTGYGIHEYQKVFIRPIGWLVSM
jgi:hypothetical protein